MLPSPHCGLSLSKMHTRPLIVQTESGPLSITSCNEVYCVEVRNGVMVLSNVLNPHSLWPKPLHQNNWSTTLRVRLEVTSWP